MRSKPRAMANWLLVAIAIAVWSADFLGSRTKLLAFTGERSPAALRGTGERGGPVQSPRARSSRKTRVPLKSDRECNQSSGDKSGKKYPAPIRSASPTQAIADTQAGNSIYRIYGDATGRYTITTGPNHPAGGGLNVLFGDGKPGTSFNTIRSYTTNTDYTQSATASSSNSISLAQFATVTANGTIGIRTTYQLPGPPATPDALTIIQELNVNGTTFDDSAIELTTTVINNGASMVEIGIRYLWDYEIGNDDGPTF